MVRKETSLGKSLGPEDCIDIEWTIDNQDLLLGAIACNPDWNEEKCPDCLKDIDPGLEDYVMHAQPLEGLEWATGPVSTLTGGMLMNMLRCDVAERLLARGIKPELLPSHQLVDNVSSEEQLERFYEGYRKSLKHLYE